MKKVLLGILFFNSLCQAVFWLPKFSIVSGQSGKFSVDIGRSLTGNSSAVMIWPDATSGMMARIVRENINENQWGSVFTLEDSGVASSNYGGIDVRYVRHDPSVFPNIVSVWHRNDMNSARSSIFSSEGVVEEKDLLVISEDADNATPNEIISGQHSVDIDKNNTDNFAAFAGQAYTDDAVPKAYTNAFLETNNDWDTQSPIISETSQSVNRGATVLSSDGSDTVLNNTLLGTLGIPNTVGATFCYVNSSNAGLNSFTSCSSTLNSIVNTAQPSANLFISGFYVASQKSADDNRIGIATANLVTKSFSGQITSGKILFNIFSYQNRESSSNGWGSSFSEQSRTVSSDDSARDHSAVAMNINGDAVATWPTLDNTILARYYNKSNGDWETIKTLYTGTDLTQSSVTVGIDDNGNAVATWADNTTGGLNPNKIFGAVYVRDIDQWIQAQEIQDGSFTNFPQASVMCAQDAAGATVIGWSDATLSERAATVNRFRETVQINNVESILNTIDKDSITQTRVTSIPPFEIAAEPEIQAIQSDKDILLNRFATQTEFFNHITWKKQPGVRLYEIYRNVDCSALGNVAPLATTRNLFYDDHNRVPNNNDTYCVVAVGGANFCNNLEWPIFPGAVEYKLTRNDNMGSGDVLIATLNNNDANDDGIIEYTDCEVVAGVTYTYELQICAPEGIGCNVLEWDAVVGACGYNVYRADGNNPTCLLSTKTKEIGDGSRIIFPDCLAPEGQQYCVSIRTEGQSIDCECDRFNRVNWDGSTVNTTAHKAGGFNIYRDGVFLVNVPQDTPEPTSYDDKAAGNIEHNYVVVAVDNDGVETYPFNGRVASPACIGNQLDCCIANTSLCP